MISCLKRKDYLGQRQSMTVINEMRSFYWLKLCNELIYMRVICHECCSKGAANCDGNTGALLEKYLLQYNCSITFDKAS